MSTAVGTNTVEFNTRLQILNASGNKDNMLSWNRVPATVTISDRTTQAVVQGTDTGSAWLVGERQTQLHDNSVFFHALELRIKRTLRYSGPINGKSIDVVAQITDDMFLISGIGVV